MIRLFARGFQQGMAGFGMTISALVNSVLLSVVYLIGVGLTYTASKTKGKKFLDIEHKEDSYWNEVAQRSTEMDEHYRQF